ncbi:MAG: hypothetical protein HQK78_08425 [Desulfobacterales bacterium]|nr:hypothetical protein [Desulfobacterales bacterium]
MSFSINTNLNGMWGQNQLQETNKSLSSSLDKFSSAKRINKSADDASYMLISDGLDSQIRGITEAMMNVNDAVSISQIADGGLGDATDIINTIRNKALEASNDSQNPESRAAIQSDIKSALENLNQIVQNTSYNGKSLLSGQFSNQIFHIGPNADETTKLSVQSTKPSNIGDSTYGKLTDIDVTTSEGAEKAIKISDAALKNIDSSRSEIGSFQNQLVSSMNILSIQAINESSSQSSIQDLDFSEESMVFSKMKALNDAKMFALAQGNVQASNVVNLLQD